jgi:hypothetical protein
LGLVDQELIMKVDLYECFDEAGIIDENLSVPAKHSKPTLAIASFLAAVFAA